MIIFTNGLMQGLLNLLIKFCIVMHTVGKEAKKIGVHQNLRGGGLNVFCTEGRV